MADLNVLSYDSSLGCAVLVLYALVRKLLHCL